MDADNTEPQRRENDTADESERGATGLDREGRHGDEHHSSSEATGFVWCEPVGSEPSESGFEWGGAVDESGETAGEEPRREADSEDPDGAEGDDGLSLDPTLVTTTRGAGIDDEAVSLLAAFRDHRRRDRDSDR